MKSSARNQFTGKVALCIKGMINSEIAIDIGFNTKIIAVITNESVSELGLIVGKEVTALIKASAVILFPGETPVKTSAENMIKGTVREVRLGMVSGEVFLDLEGGKTVTAVVTKESVEALNVKVGMAMYAGFGSSQVILLVQS